MSVAPLMMLWDGLSVLRILYTSMDLALTSLYLVTILIYFLFKNISYLLLRVLLTRLWQIISMHCMQLDRHLSKLKVQREFRVIKSVHLQELHFTNGDLVYFKRDRTENWMGPGTVMVNENQQILMKYGGTYIRLDPCCI